jgi:hypothetical protein
MRARSATRGGALAIAIALLASSSSSSAGEDRGDRPLLADGEDRGDGASNISTWHVVWVGGQSNSVGTNSQTTGYPVWPLTPNIQMFCWKSVQGCEIGSFSPAKYPVFNEANVGFSLTYANMLLQSLPSTDGVVLINTGVGGTGFQDGEWVVPDGPLVVQSIKAVSALAEALPQLLGGNMSFHSLLWHQGEEE